MTVERRRKLTKMVFFSFLSAVLDVAGIALLVVLIHYITITSLALSPLQISIYSLGIILFFLLKNIFTLYLTKIQASFAFSESLINSTSIFKTIYNQNELFFRDQETGSLISDIMYVPNAFSNGVILGYITLITELAVMLLMMIFLAITSPYISLLLIFFIAPTAFYTYRSIEKKVELLGNLRNRNVQQAQDSLVQGLNAHTDATVYNRKDFFGNIFHKFQLKISEIDSSVYTLNSVPAKFMELFAVMAFCLLYIYHRQVNPENSFAFDMALFVAAAFRLLPSVNRTLGSILRIKNHWFAIDILKGYQNKKKSVINDEEFEFNKNIILEKIEFGYNETKICSVEFLEIKKGSCIGIFGNTGEGKSTFLKLLLQLIPADKGKFKLDGILITPEKTKAFAQLFAYVRQDVFILNATLQENISLSANNEYNHKRVDEIIVALNLSSIAHLFFDENNIAGEAGSKLSGGQKKLIALARALYFNRPVIILDEALASLDPDTAKTVMNVLKEEIKKGKTIIIVSHEKNVFEICDTVYEFKNGSLINQD